MQQKNLLVFVVLCITILVGWGMLQNALWPRKKKDEQAASKKQDEKPKLAPPLTREALRRVAPQVAAMAVADAHNPLSPLPAVAFVAAREFEVAASRERAFKAEQFRRELPQARPQLAGLVGDPKISGVAFVLGRLALGPRFKEPSELLPDIALGGPDYYLQAKLTRRGAGVQRLTLSQFQAADEWGRPMYEQVNGQRQEVKLDLIPEDPIRPSFLMFHYPYPAEDPDDPNPAKRSHPSPFLGEVVWKVEEDGVNDSKERKVVFTFDHIPGYEGVKIRKTFTLGPRDYHIGLSVEIVDGRTAPPPGEKLSAFRYQLSGAHGLPIEGEWFASVYRHPMLGLVTRAGHFWRDLEETQQRIAFREGGDRVPLQSGESTIQYAGVANQYFTSLIVVDNKQAPADKGGVKPEEVVDYARPTLESQEKPGRVVGLKIDAKDPAASYLALQMPGSAFAVKFRLLAGARKDIEQNQIEPLQEVLVNFYKTVQGESVATGVRRGRVPRPHLEDITVRVVSNALFGEQRPGKKVAHQYLLYNGPVKVSLLGQFTGPKAVDPELVERYWGTLNLRTLTDYHSPGPLGAFANKIFWTDLIVMFTRLMHGLLNLLHFVLPNYGLTIILLTLIVRAMMFPISKRQAMLSVKMQELQPEVKKVQEKYKNDPQARNRAVMELYRKHSVNPLGGCLTLFLQLPVFMGLYYALQESIHFRLAGFLWIDNLAAPDMLVWWGESIPIISNPDNMGGIGYLGPYFNLLPVVAVVLMLVQQKMMTPPPADEQQAMQQKMFKFMMVLMGFLFYKMPAGLCLYFIVSSLWGVLERRFLPKKQVPGAASGGGGPGRGPGGGGGGGPGKGGGPGGGGRGKGRPGKKDKESDGAIQKVRSWWQEVLKQAKKK